MGLRLTTVAATLVLGVVATTGPAYAATGSPPVTTPDRAVVRAGQPTPVDVAANDTDPDGDEVRACRLGPLPRALRASVVDDGQLLVLPRPTARGTYRLTYYACDTSFLTPGTVTVKVRPPAPTVDVIPLRDLPGPVKIVNTFRTRTFHCAWQPLGVDRVEGRATVPPRSSVVVRVNEADVEFECVSGNRVYGFGFVTAGRSVRLVDEGGSGHSGRRRTPPYSANASGGGQAQTRLRSP